MENLAAKYLREHNETTDDYDGVCGELANAICEDGDHTLWVEGDIGWKFHMVLLRDGLVHDAWCEGDALPPREWLIRMFGAEAVVEVSLNGDTIYEEMAHYFSDDLTR